MSREQPVRAQGLKTLGAFIKKIDDDAKESALISVLYEAQNIFGYLSKDAILFISDKLNVPAAKIYGVVSFYSFFTTEPKGRNQVKLCMGTACFVSGAKRIAKEMEQQLDLKVGKTSADRKFSLEALRCVGACGLAPVVLVNEAVYGKVNIDDVSKIIRECKD
jgi:NADH-quinone oxidoreductase subunit E